jgi:DNA-directed RNA polymerase subunit M/transcription elongation factor TFIIS
MRAAGDYDRSGSDAHRPAPRVQTNSQGYQCVDGGSIAAPQSDEESFTLAQARRSANCQSERSEQSAFFRLSNQNSGVFIMAKVAKTADRKKVMDTSKSTDCPKCGKPTRIVKRMKDRERNLPGGIYISCSACEFFEKL